MHSLEPVLIEGELTKSKLSRIRQEIAGCAARGQSVMLVIKSHGGKLDATLEFLGWLIETKEQIKVSAKIYVASSAAAMIALAAHERRISSDGEFNLHIGAVTLDTNDICKKSGAISERFQKLLRASHENLFRLVKESAPRLPVGKLCTLDATGVLEITPAECIEYGICSDIF